MNLSDITIVKFDLRTMLRFENQLFAFVKKVHECENKETIHLNECQFKKSIEFGSG